MKRSLIYTVIILVVGFQSQAEARNFFADIVQGVGRVFSGSNEKPKTETTAIEQDKADYWQGDDTDVYVVIDRNPKVQMAYVHLNGSKKPAMKCKVSTGRETFDTPTNFSLPPYCSNTPKGLFSPTLLRELNRSNAWLTKNAETGEYTEGSEMWHSTFFNGGVAIHRATPSGISTLGPKDDAKNGGSGGCVRMDDLCAKYVFDKIARVEIDPVTKKPVLNAETQQPMYDSEKPVKHCAQAPDDPRCTESLQWPVHTNGKVTKIHVVDSRNKADEDAAANRCQEQRDAFDKRKFRCMEEKMFAADPELQKKKDAKIYDFTLELRALGSRDAVRRAEFSAFCNQKIFEEDHPPVANQQAFVAPKPRPRPDPDQEAEVLPAAANAEDIQITPPPVVERDI